MELVCPFSLRPPPIGVKDFEYHNDFAIVPIDLGLHSDIKTGVVNIAKDMSALKKSIKPIGMYYVNAFTMI